MLKPNSISKPAAAVRTQLNKSSIQSCSTQRRNQMGYFAAEPWLLGHESLPSYNIMLNGHVTTKGLLLLIKLNSWFRLVDIISAHSSFLCLAMNAFYRRSISQMIDSGLLNYWKINALLYTLWPWVNEIIFNNSMVCCQLFLSYINIGLYINPQVIPRINSVDIWMMENICLSWGCSIWHTMFSFHCLV